MQIHTGNCVGGKGVAYWVDILLHEKFIKIIQHYKNEKGNITKMSNEILQKLKKYFVKT
jgi:hypothetical protein